MRSLGNAVTIPPMPNGICAVIVTFRPDPGFPARVSRIMPQVGRVVIVDNGSEAGLGSLLWEVSKWPHVHLIQNSENCGIATALNQGVRWARARGFGWTLLMDQDTVAGESMVLGLIQVYGDFPERERLAVLGSGYTSSDSTRAGAGGGGRTPSWKETNATITSGSLLSVAAFGDLGAFRDDFFIDHVDHEYCLRARRKGYKVIQTRAPLMAHSIGTTSWHRFPWSGEISGATVTSNHPAVRRYYMVRNLLAVARRYADREPLWVAQALRREARSLVSMMLFERDRLAKLRAIGRGLLDGLCGRTGKRMAP